MSQLTCVLAGHPAVRPLLSLLACGLLSVGLAGCEAQDLSLAPEVVADPIRITTADDAPAIATEDSALLHFVNAPDTSFAVLDEDVGLDPRAAERIVRHRDGADLEAGTEDDLLFVSLDDLLEVPYVGGAVLEAIDDYLVELAQDGAQVEGVAFTDEEAALALALANTASFEELDEELELDRRAAQGIVEQRPFSTLAEIAEVAYVGPASLERLRAATAELGGQ